MSISKFMRSYWILFFKYNLSSSRASVNFCRQMFNFKLFTLTFVQSLRCTSLPFTYSWTLATFFYLHRVSRQNLWSCLAIQSQQPMRLLQNYPIQTISQGRLCVWHFRIVFIIRLQYIIYQITNFKFKINMIQDQSLFPGKISQRYTKQEAVGLKIILLLVLTVGFCIYRIVYYHDLTKPCFYDILHVLLYPINRLMDKDKYSIIILIGQWFMELSLLGIIAIWLLKIKNARMPMAAAFFYGLRTISLNIFLLPFPDDIVWRQPFIPSFLVPYDRTRDFYFSGHTGIAIIITLQVFKLKLPFWVKSYCFVMLGWLMTMLIASRVHYSIDIIGGVIFAVLCFDVAQSNLYYVDVFWSIPAILFRKMKEKCCPQQEEDNRLMQDVIK